MQKKLVLFIPLIFILFFSINTYAEKTVKTIDLPFGFVASSTANQNYTKNITLVSPDGISKIISAEVMVRGDFLASTRVILWTNKKQCSPTQIITPATASNNYDFTFDCSALTDNITSGNYTITLNTNRTATNLYVNTRFTYYNNPKADLIMHGTEYKTNENGKIFLQLLDTSKIPIKDSQCIASIYYPDSSVFVDSQIMTYLDDGLYYYNFNVPYMLGVYMSVATCRVPNPDAVINTSYDGFECGSINCGTGWSTNWTLGSPDAVTILAGYNGTYGLRQSNASGYAFRNFTVNTTAESIALSFWARGKIGANKYAYVWLCNTTKCILAKQFSSTDTYYRDYTITFNPSTTNITNLKRIKINASATFGTGDYMDFDDIRIEQRKLLNATEYQELKGSGEVHVTNGIESENCFASSEFYNYSDYDFDGNPYEFAEGLAIYNIIVESQSNSNDAPASFYFETPYKYDCSSINQFQKYNGTDWNDAIDEIAEYEKGENEESCKIKIITLINKSQTLEYRINLVNYQKWEIDWSINTIDNINRTVYDFCMNISDELGFTYEIPLNRTTIMSNITALSLCHGIFDDIYWTYSAYNQVLNGEISEEGALTEIASYRAELFRKSALLWQVSMNYTSTSPISPSAIWNYASRTLTDYNHTEILQYLQDINYTVNNLNVSGGSVNITGILNYLAEINATTHSINSSMVTYYGNLYNLMVSINASIANEINAINSTINANIFAINGSLTNHLYGITGKLQEIQDNITTVYNLIGASNTTIMNKLYRIQDEITSVNDTVKSINQSIHSHLDSIDSTLNSIQGDLSQIKGNLTEIKAILQEINSTTYLISGKIDSLSLDLASINASLISYIGTSLNGLEANLTTLIISVNSTVVSSNATIMNKLYGIQGEIANMTDTIVNNLLNITNITANITLSQQEVMNTMVALYGNQAKNRNFAYLGVGITGLLAGGDSGAVQYCKDNMTLATYSVQNVSGSINMTNVFEDLTRCTYGCVKDACVIPQYMIWLYVLIALIGVFVVYLWFERIGWMSGE